jgi:hypothetical protein
VLGNCSTFNKNSSILIDKSRSFSGVFALNWISPRTGTLREIQFDREQFPNVTSVAFSNTPNGNFSNSMEIPMTLQQIPLFPQNNSFVVRLRTVQVVDGHSYWIIISTRGAFQSQTRDFSRYEFMNAIFAHNVDISNVNWTLNGVEQGLIASRFTVCIESTSFTI